MQASIYKPSKTSMQSGMHNASSWVLEFNRDIKRSIDPVMDWVSSSDTMREVKMKFPTKEAAIDFAAANSIDYEVIEPHEKKITIRPYAENFK